MGTIILIVLITWASIATYSAWKSRKVALEALALVEKAEAVHSHCDPSAVHSPESLKFHQMAFDDPRISYADLDKMNHMTDEELDTYWGILKDNYDAAHAN